MKKFKNSKIDEIKLLDVTGGNGGVECSGSAETDDEGCQVTTCIASDTYCGYGIGYRTDTKEVSSWVTSC